MNDVCVYHSENENKIYKINVIGTRGAGIQTFLYNLNRKMHNLFYPQIGEKLIIDAEFSSASSTCKTQFEKIQCDLNEMNKEQLEYIVACDLLFVFSECHQASVQEGLTLIQYIRSQQCTQPWCFLILNKVDKYVFEQMNDDEMNQLAYSNGLIPFKISATNEDTWEHLSFMIIDVLINRNSQWLNILNYMPSSGKSKKKHKGCASQ